MPTRKTPELRGNRNLKRLSRISQTKQQQEVERSLVLGLEGAGSIVDQQQQEQQGAQRRPFQ